MRHSYRALTLCHLIIHLIFIAILPPSCSGPRMQNLSINDRPLAISLINCQIPYFNMRRQKIKVKM